MPLNVKDFGTENVFDKYLNWNCIGASSGWLRLGFEPGQTVTNIISPIVVNEVSISPFFVKYFQHFLD
jgi:hypothetical protein